MNIISRKVGAFFGLFAITASLALITPLKAKAVDTSLTEYLNNQHYNNLVSDSDFTAYNSMSVQDIQSFLVAKGGYLASATPDQLGSGANGRNAAQIIYDAAHASYPAAQGMGIDESTGTISPKAIIITLQKEQSLITTAGYSQSALDHAMGYGCPDSGGCDPKYLGFSNQVGWGAWQLRYRYNVPASPFIAGHVTSIADWDGTRSVYFSNASTASLFRYTPHTYYGNYNFWRLGIEWFSFGIGSGSGGSGVNDTSSVTARFYSNHGNYVIKGMKQSSVTVSYNGSIIAGAGSTSWQYSLAPTLGTHDYVFSYSTGETKTITVEERKNGDINGDGVVNLLDLSLIGGAYGQTVKDDDWRNLNPDVDNEINLLDISIFANNWEG